MSFYEKQQKAIIQDEEDNKIIQNLNKNYCLIKEKYQAAERQNTQLLKEIDQLKQINQKLQSQINFLKEAKCNQTTSHTKVNTFQSKQPGKLFLSEQTFTPTLLNKTIQRTFYAQQTKRKVINGFVDQITQQLQMSQDLLKRERIMQEQTRRTLQLCNQEQSLLRITIKGLENQVTVVTRQNQQLIRQLQTVIRQKKEIQEKLSANMLEYKKLKGNFMINAEQFQAEMLKMDTIYKNIEYQLEGMK